MVLSSRHQTKPILRIALRAKKHDRTRQATGETAVSRPTMDPLNPTFEKLFKGNRFEGRDLEITIKLDRATVRKLLTAAKFTDLSELESIIRLFVGDAYPHVVKNWGTGERDRWQRAIDEALSEMELLPLRPN